MNKRHYKVIFSRVLNQLVVVSELAKSQGKAQSENMSSEQAKTGLFSTALSLNPIHFSLMLALGFVFLSPSVQAEDMAIRADKSAPGNQQPTVLQTGNGIPQVNIQAPSQAGVSRNQYSQFDVAEKGAVLNNARKAAQTQMAGWVQGNPNLARGEAKVILNEVNSANPSRLKGYVEVAGKKADVVIANPSGIQCDGCGVINAGRATFTTGKAEVENGELKGYRVQGGKVSVGQKGMDTSKADYTDIIADKAEIKGGVWGNKVKVTTGKNKVDRTNDSVVYVGDKNTNETDRTSESQNDQAQAYSVDVGQLGGMYAEKIHLVDNGQGLGVRNAGHIGAAAGDVKIDSQGKIINSGTISSTQQAELSAKKTIENTGKIETKQGNVSLRSQANVAQHGSIVSRQGGISVQAKDKVTQTGETVVKGNVAYQAKNIEASKGALIAAGVTAQETTQGETRSLDSQSAQGASITLSAENSVSSKAQHLASGQINAKAGTLDLSESQSTADSIAFQSTYSPLNLKQATLYSEGNTTLISPDAILVENTNLNAGHFSIDTAQLNNKKSSWIQRGKEAFSLNLKKGLDNTEGKIAAEGLISIQSPLIQNNQGVIWSNQGVKLNTNAGHIESQSGYLFGKNSLDISTSTLNNHKGEMLGGQVLLTAQQVNNEDGKLIAGNRADLSVNQFNNQHGIVYSQGQLSLKTENLHNQDGIISSVSRATLLANDLNNLKGVIQGESDLTIQTQNLNNTQGDISAKTAAISSAAINNAQGVISSQDLTLSGTDLNNKGGIIQSVNSTLNLTALDNQAEGDKGSLVSATNRLVLNVTNVNNKNTKAKQDTPTQGIQTANLVMDAEHIENQSGGIYAGKSANITVNQSLDNQKGEILSTGRVDIVNPDLTLVVNNALGTIESVIGTTLQAKTLVDEGSISTKGDLGIELNDSFTLNKAFGVGNNLTFKTKGDFVNNSNLVVGNSASVEGSTIQNSANAEISSINTRIQTNKLNNFGLIDGDTTVIKANDVNNIGTARIYGGHLAIQANNLNNLENADGTAATIAARERLDLGVGNLVNRNHSLIMSLGNIYIGGQLNENNQATGYANSIDNGSATIEALGSGWIKTHSLLNHDLHLKLGHKYTKNHFVTYSPFDSSATYYGNEGEKGEGYLDHVNNSRHNSNQYFRFNDGRQAVAAQNWLKQDYIRTTDTNTIEHQDPGKLLIGQSLHLEGGEYTNKHSRIVIGDTLYLADKAIKEPVSTVSQGLLKLDNIDVDGEIHRRDIGLKKDIKKEHRYHGMRGKKVWAVYGRNEQKIDRLLPVEPFKFGLELLKIGEPVESTGAIVGNKSDFQGISLAEKTPLNTDLNVHRVNLEAITSGVMKNKDNLDIKTHLPDISLPQASLYKINPAVSGQFLVETDPRFTQRSKWLSSDYMFKQIHNDPKNILKRLGDGFYEQRLVNEQINQLTGRRFLQGYSSDYEQYKALMDNGAQYAKKLNLIPGVALTAEQMKQLTSDMVWMVKREVTLKDGSKKEVLAPQVYVVGRNADIDSRGAVISANDVIVNIQGDIQNSGVISGRNLTHLAANNIENLGGKLQGRELYLKAKETLNNLGGELNAEDRLVAQAKNINIESRTSETEDTGNFYRKSLVQQASINVGRKDAADKGQKGNALLMATENITVKGANFNIKGDAVLQAGDKLNLDTIETQNKEHYVSNADNYYKLDQKQEVGSQLNVTGNFDAIGKSAVEMRGVSATSNGTMNVMSEGNINIQEARYKEQLSSGSKSKSRGLTSSTTEVYRHKHDYDVAEASNLDADKIYIHSNKGNVNIQGSNAVAENGLVIKANNIDIREAENRVYSDDYYSKKKSGMLGGGIGVTFGSQKQTTESDQTKLYAQGSQVGSLNGNTTMIADNNYRQTASTVSAVKGDVNILAKKVQIKAADDKYETNNKQTFQQKGLNIAITSPVLSAIQAVQGAVQSTKQVGASKHDRVNAMAAANAGFDAYRAGDSVMKAGKSIQDFMDSGNMDSVVGVQITYGQQKNESRTHIEGNTAAKSKVNAGGKVNIGATGAGKDSNISIEGSDVSGKQGTFLSADNQVIVKAVEQNHKERSTNKSSGFNAGVAIKVGSGVAAGATFGGNYGKGYGNGDETTSVASHVGDSQSKTVINAGGDVTLAGSQVKGKRVELDAENLNIESLQDKSSYHGKQMNMQGSVTVGYGFAAGGSFNKSKINADHASVNEQAGIYAGDEGYDINVNKHTDLKGALITSTQKAEADGKNHFSTGSLTHSDIENHSNYSGSSFGVSGSVSANFETPFGENGAAQSTKQATDKDGNLLYTDKNGNTTVNSKGVDGQENTKKLAEGKESLQFSYGMGYGKDSDSQSSTTKSGINTQNIIIKDEAEQLKRTGKTVQEEITAIKTDITTESAQSQSGKLENRFNKDDVQKELDFQREVTEKFGPNVAEAGSLLANKFGEEAKAKRNEAAIALEEAEKAKAENNNETNQALVKQARDNFETASREAKEWETGGSQRLVIDSALNVISTALAGRPAAEVVASGLSPAVNNQIKKATTDAKGNVNTALNLTAHALWGAVEAYAGNRNVAAGAAGAAGGEVAAHFLASTLYNKSPEKLSEEEKRTVSSLSQVAAGIAGGSLSDSSDGAIIAAKTAKDSVENNSMADDVHPSNERKQNIEMYAKVLFNGDEDKAKEYQEGLELAEAQGQIDSIKETADAVVNLDDTVVSLWEAISNPKKTYNNVVVSLKDWDEAYALALQENPKLAGEMQGYRQGKMKGVSTGGVVLSGTGLALVKPMGALKNGVVDFTKNQVNRVVNHTVLNRVINEVDNIAVSTDKGFINGTKVCGASCEIKATSKAEQALIDDIVKNGDIKGGKTESLIHGLAKRSGYEPLQGGKYGSNNGFDHVLVGKDGSVVIIDSKQIKNNGSIQVSSKGAGDTNQLSEKWIKEVVYKLPENDPTRTAIIKAIDNDKSVKTIIAGVDKSNGKVVLLPVRVPNKK
ncbi:hemagglutinin repeat-containing protein [uncultured Haemophilus sp.]|uniref:two-partner secretion domain-containing protein n=1 Tax=uncultured Haemophilus sp. TaxID=237779 RepID=UPI0025D3EEA2|nr:hemagglutinin repeat-containing protein [uncultured Haemophilus sp.]